MLDAVLLTGALAGLAELVIGGDVTSASSGSLGLLVPGLLGLAAAVVASRLLPAACGLAFAVTRRRGGTGLFLAVRHIARRPGGTRTTIVLTAAFALATFAVAAFAVDQRNVDRVATAQTGAAAVLTVTAPAGQDLGTIVDRIDPGGRPGRRRGPLRGRHGQWRGAARRAAATVRAGGAVAIRLSRPPARLPRRGARSARSPRPSRCPPGPTAVRVRVTGQTGIAPGTDLTLWVVEAGSPDGGQVPVSLGALHQGWLSAALTACPCQVTMVSIDPPTVTPGPTQGSVTLSGLGAHRPAGRLGPGPAALASAAGWAAGAENQAGCDDYRGPGPGGARPALVLPLGSACSPALHRQDTPARCLRWCRASSPAASRPSRRWGLDGRQLMVRPVALAAAVPGAPAVGIVVDRTYAQRKAFFADDSLVTEQVWVAPGALAAVRAKLAAAGVRSTAWRRRRMPRRCSCGRVPPWPACCS